MTQNYKVTELLGVPRGTRIKINSSISEWVVKEDGLYKDNRRDVGILNYLLVGLLTYEVI